MIIVFHILWYSILLAVSIIAVVLRAINTTRTFLDIETYILIATALYAIYMLIVEKCINTDGKAGEALLGGDKKEIVRDYAFKYIFAFDIGIVFLAVLVGNLNSGFNIFPEGLKWYRYIEIILSQYVVPIMIIVEIFITPRGRKCYALWDTLVIIIICAIFIIIGIIDQGIHWHQFGTFVMRVIFAFDALILYDFILYKKNGGTSGFVLFYNA